MTNIEKRIEQLEKTEGGRVCPTCGDNKGGPACFEISKEPMKRESAPTKTCPDCGRLLKFTLEFGTEL